MKRAFFLAFTLILLLQSCQNTPQDENLRLSFSVDTLLFDTIFTNMGSTTRKVMIYNQNKQAITISSVRQAGHGVFYYNLDGENCLDSLNNLTLRGGDSLFLFVKAHINPLNSNNPVLITDQLLFSLQNGATQTLQVEAFGQDVILIDSIFYTGNKTFDGKRPYLVLNYVASAPGTTLTFPAGTTFYMHNNAFLQIQGNVHCEGTVEAPVTFTTDRLDYFVTDIPYRHVPGLWSGIYLYDENATGNTWDFEHTSVISAVNAIYCYAPNTAGVKPQLSLNSCRLHNHDQYGLIMQNMDAVVANSEISNCASYCVYLSGGNYQFFHNTIASYFRFTAYPGMYDTQREDVAAVYINNISKEKDTHVSFYNNIITGVRKNQLVIATPLPDIYSGTFICNYIKTDSLNLRNAYGNVYAHEKDTVFRNNYYGDYTYYDFRLDSISPARGIADSATASHYPLDILGNSRILDAGCYQYLPDSTIAE